MDPWDLHSDRRGLLPLPARLVCDFLFLSMKIFLLSSDPRRTSEWNHSRPLNGKSLYKWSKCGDEGMAQSNGSGESRLNLRVHSQWRCRLWGKMRERETVWHTDRGRQCRQWSCSHRNTPSKGKGNNINSFTSIQVLLGWFWFSSKNKKILERSISKGGKQTILPQKFCPFTIWFTVWRKENPR